MNFRNCTNGCVWTAHFYTGKTFILVMGQKSSRSTHTSSTTSSINVGGKHALGNIRKLAFARNTQSTDSWHLIEPGAVAQPAHDLFPSDMKTYDT
jgi:hypothetical protein